MNTTQAFAPGKATACAEREAAPLYVILGLRRIRDSIQSPKRKKTAPTRRNTGSLVKAALK